MLFAWGFCLGVLALSALGFVAEVLIGHEPTPYDADEFESCWQEDFWGVTS
jgi:hypothetical protein